ncbi:MAG TPA: NrfD/PsrC family molybdoenzyme membrane anchor subunit [Anaerolineales bacterium]|nr:NrfD/PsrC family molybdoenzyme membrane anchor subunit [Anaerolineales bacterium]
MAKGHFVQEPETQIKVCHHSLDRVACFLRNNPPGRACCWHSGLLERSSIPNLTDLVPWGLWITIDLSSIALAAGAFSLCAAVHLFGLKRYEPIARTATFIGLIGYTLAMLALVLDIGRPDRFWKSLVYWNTHSLLWEVTIAIMLYTTVLVFETMPIFARFEWLRKRFPKIVAKMERIYHYAPILAIIGLGLSSMHQSSLGAAYGIIKG